MINAIFLQFVLGVSFFVDKLSRFLKIGKGSSAPGLVALKIYPNIIYDLVKIVDKGVILVTATNGKTTTTALIYEMLLGAGHKVISNYEGANLLTGIATSLLRAKRMGIGFDYAVFEVDEAYFPMAIEALNPKMVVMGNLFRDQLDRFGEIDTLAKKWKQTVSSKQDLTIICNGNDPGTYFAVKDCENVFYYGVKGEKEKLKYYADSINCINCKSRLNYEEVVFSHLGNFKCSKCGFKMPKLDLDAKVNSSYPLEVIIDKNSFKSNLIGKFNAYNLVSAVLAASKLGVDEKIIKRVLHDFEGVFGRLESFNYKGKEFLLALIKNPTGANAVIESLDPKNIIGILNDRIADGKDVSWIWDVDYEGLVKRVNKFYCLGDRKEDLALRLKYAGLKKENIIIKSSIWEVFNKLSQEPDKYILILATYTAMMELRKSLEDRKLVRKI